MLQNNSHFATMQSNRSTTHNPLSKSFSAHWGSEMGFTKHALFLPSEPSSSFANKSATPNNPHGMGVFFVVCVAFPPSPEMLKCKAGMWDAVGGAWSCMGRQWGAGGGLPITHKDERTGKALEKLLHWQPAAFPPPFCILERFCERQ